MRTFVTGASGFVGANLVHELVARGHEVRALVRPGADVRGLEGASYERISGDLSDRTQLKAAMKGCEWCFHLAASYHLWLRDYRPMYATNVEGTANVLQAAADAGCQRIVYTSTVGCVGLNGTTPADETSLASEAQMLNDYKRSKWKAEQVALGLAQKGLPIIIVNPSAPFGPRDSKPTPTGKFVLDYLNGALPAYLETGLNLVHVRDVAVGHILAAEKGKIGERYILGNMEGNWTMWEVLNVLEEITGLPAPKFRVPYWIAYGAARVENVISKCTGEPPRAPLGGVRMARNKMFFSPAKAIRELGLPQTPPRQALLDATNWFRENGFVRQGRDGHRSAMTLPQILSRRR
jgi:dihydroflavonol-4-reductase